MILKGFFKLASDFWNGTLEKGKGKPATLALQRAIEAELQRLRYEDEPLCNKIAYQKSSNHRLLNRSA